MTPTPSDADKAALAQKAARLESKQLYVKAAEIYAQLGEEGKAAVALEKAGAYDKAEALFLKLGDKEGAARCKKAAEDQKNPQTWSELQTEFVAEFPV